MPHHAYFVSAQSEEGIAASLRFSKDILGIHGADNPDLIVLRFGLFSADDARKITDLAQRSASGAQGKVIIASAPRFFHEAQNILLKIFEEPPEGVTLILVVPSEGLIVPTLRSRLLPLPHTEGSAATYSPLGAAFLEASQTEREKLLTKLIDRSKSDKDEEKQAARADSVALCEDLTKAAYEAKDTVKTAGEREVLMRLLTDLARFQPILHERSAPLKLIFEHLLLVIPTTLGKRGV